MLSLTYLSSASAPLDNAELEEILAVSRRNNQAAGLTGMLLYADEHFVQTLEGEAEVVDAAYARIGADPRHRNVILALRERIEVRTFTDWSMGFTVLAGEEVAAIPGFSDFLNPDSSLYANVSALGRAGIFHRIFRDKMRRQVA